ncbi:hypothetical protein ACFPIJ_17455 [Dactylosporangium cerinum]|uniref:Uncharacterized protein n=1 Tax=Dactylosporangium cerinum TaxID=1434730 RepID=A0ABV9VU05_9ACTN
MADEPARRLTVHVDATPDPHRLRAAIAGALSGHATGAGPEAQIARAVADAVRESTVEGHR